MPFVIVGSLALCFAYAFTRYVVAGDVSPDQTPVFIVNKAVSLAAALFLALAARASLKGAPQEARTFGAATAHCALLHILLSLPLIRPAYFPSFFNGERFSGLGGASILFGALTAYFYGLLFTRRPDRPGFLWLKTGAAGALIGHLVFMGFPKWIRPTEWPGRLPNVSLISCLFALAALAFCLRGRFRTSSQDASDRKT